MPHVLPDQTYPQSYFLSPPCWYLQEAMDAKLSDGLGLELVGRYVITRSGTPLRPGDLERVALAHANTVVVMSPNGDSEVTKGTACWVMSPPNLQLL